MRKPGQLGRIADADTAEGRIFDLVIQCLIVLSVLAFALETLPDLQQNTRRWLRAFEVGCVVVFTAEYALRLLTAESKRRFAFSFFGVVDLLSILPFYLSLGIDLRSLRSLRLLRLFRVLKLTRYSRATRRFYVALATAKEEFVLFLSLTLILLFLSAVGIYQFEHDAQPEVFSSVFASLWWAVTTLTTVGYGDSYPVTPGGKFFTFLVLMIGLGVVSVPAGIVASAMNSARIIERSENTSSSGVDTPQ